MVLTRSRSGAKGTEAPTPKVAAPVKSAPKRKNNGAASAPVSKAAKTDAATDLSEAKKAEETETKTDENETKKVQETEAKKTDETKAKMSEKSEIKDKETSPEAAASNAKDATHATLHAYDVIVSDIEGTTTPIVFVKENLFPYVTSGLPEFLKRNWGTEEMNSAIEALRVQAAKDIADGLTEATPIAVESADVTAEKVQQDVIASIGWQMRADRKIGALKAFQGYMWKEGYANGNLKGELYSDVIPAMDQWKSEGKKIYIYSSGSIAAQKLLFGYSQSGDLLHYFAGHYDTTIGQKVNAESYTKIAADIDVDPSKILFLSDNIHEIVAAKKAGFQAVITHRPGNAPLSAEERAAHIVVKSFLDIPKPVRS
ncbi:Enolase-phosphatase E1 [Podila epigama]|nr:Enolase-phosphatase E1 [Podila epigama]